MATTTAVPKTRISGGSFLLEERRPDEVFTPEDFTEQHQLIGQTAEEFAVNEILPNIEKIEHKDFSVSRDLLKKAGELGLSGVEIPEAYGGLEMDKVTAAVIADHIAKYAGFATTWGGHSGIGTAAHRLFRHRGAEEEISAAAGGRRNRRRICLVGSLFRLRRPELPRPRRTFARRQALHPERRKDVDHQRRLRRPVHRLCQSRRRKVHRIPGREELFPDSPIGAEEHKMGIRGSSTCPIILNDCKVPAENLLGEIGKGHVIAFNILNVGRFKLGAMCVGGGRVSLENAIGYAKQRKAFGKVIADFGLVREKLANMATLLYVGESLVYRTVGMMDVRAQRGRQIRRRRDERNPQSHRGIRGRVLHHQSLGLGDDRLRGR